MAKFYQVVLLGQRGEKMIVNLCNTEEQMKNMTVKQLKEKIAQSFPDYADNIRMIFTDKVLDNESALLSDYGIQHMSVIHIIRKVLGGGYGPLIGHGGMGDKEGQNKSMEKLYFM